MTDLPNRRPQLSEAIAWRGRSFQCGFGFDGRGRVREVFADGTKSGAEYEALLDDACILMSHMLQMGRSAAEIAEMLRRDENSVIAAIAARAAEVERETAGG